MNQHSPCAGGFGDLGEIDFCAPLQQLFDEHPPLLAKMAEFKNMVQAFEANDSYTNWNEAVEQLHEKLEIFVAELEPHADREEDILFEMMVKYIGRESGPIAVMEHEHNTAKLHLKYFFEKVASTKSTNETLTREKALEVFQHLKIVYATLTDHFMKEEQVLFPMAEKMLSDEEKEELAVKYKEMSN
ncbi:hemerythrin-like domain-containing protein [Evansella vedderi]|uniref:Hemerythrin-like domain-containing protein n=1 Tax=Evansella vedderi TaxID=38282 RepID=A0ABT9ZQQ9_9BACI|nr:hemerythrin domain-containing protein [Evansella vedderi]MDQ0253576.1 hemerythrin-like domain-containing protein [Evansella vedderi]